MRVEEDLGGGFVRLNIDESQARQAKHDIRCVEDIVLEALRNSRDAKAKNILIASCKNEKKNRSLVIIDDGSGIPQNLQEKIFEPRVTSKLDKFIIDEYGVHGRGMALYSISMCSHPSIINSHPGRGTVLMATIDTAKLPEASDQSSIPKLKQTKKGIEVQGPNNVLKSILTFNLKYPDLQIYYGNPSQIASVLYQRGIKEFDASNPFTDSQKPYIDCLSLAITPLELTKIAKNQFGLELSQRNSYRIINKEIPPPETILSLIPIKTSSNTKNKNISRSLSSYLSNEDLAQLDNATINVFNTIAEKYFIQLAEKPHFKRVGNTISVTLLLEKA